MFEILWLVGSSDLASMTSFLEVVRLCMYICEFIRGTKTTLFLENGNFYNFNPVAPLSPSGVPRQSTRSYHHHTERTHYKLNSHNPTYFNPLTQKQIQIPNPNINILEKIFTTTSHLYLSPSHLHHLNYSLLWISPGASSPWISVQLTNTFLSSM